jgi:hypothetical protein
MAEKKVDIDVAPYIIKQSSKRVSLNLRIQV